MPWVGRTAETLRSDSGDTAAVRALVVSNMWPTAMRPALGTFVRDQVDALRRRGDVDIDLATFPPGGRNYLTALPGLARRRGYDVVHAHFGLTAFPALAAGGHLRAVTLHGNDLVAPRSRRATLAVLPRYDLIAVPSEDARTLLPTRFAHGACVLPTGIDLATFSPIDRGEARRALGLDPARPFALFPHDPARAVKRLDLARLATGDHHLEILGNEPRERMRLWLNAASVVLCPSDWETFGMTAVETAACGTAVIATPTGAHAEVLSGIPWAHCGPFDRAVWRTFVAQALGEDRQYPDGPASVAPWSSDVMAGRLVDAWRSGAAAGRGARRQRQG